MASCSEHYVRHPSQVRGGRSRRRPSVAGTVTCVLRIPRGVGRPSTRHDARIPCREGPSETVGPRYRTSSTRERAMPRRSSDETERALPAVPEASRPFTPPKTSPRQGPHFRAVIPERGSTSEEHRRKFASRVIWFGRGIRPTRIGVPTVSTRAKKSSRAPPPHPLLSLQVAPALARPLPQPASHEIANPCCGDCVGRADRFHLRFCRGPLPT